MSKFRRQLMMANIEPPVPLYPYDAEVEWLKTDGSAFIDTLSNGKCQFVLIGGIDRSISSSSAMFGSRKDYRDNSFTILWYGDNSSSSGKVRLDLGTGNGSDQYTASSVANDSMIVYDGTLFSAGSQSFTPTYTSQLPLSVNNYLFAMNDNGTATSISSGGYVRRLIMLKSGATFFDGIPVRKKGVGYMYDMISGNLFGNSGTGSFVIGPDVVKPYDTEIEYLQSSGTQYIDTGLIPYSTTNIAIDFETLIVTGNTAGFFFGCRASSNSKTFDFLQYYSGTLKFRWDYGSTLRDGPAVTSGLHKATTSGNKMTIDGTTLTSGTFQSTTLPIYLFALNNNGSATCHPSCRIYSFKVIRGGIAVRDFIPVRVGQVGYMYDKVTRQLFGNAGTGNFILGNDIII